MVTGGGYTCQYHWYSLTTIDETTGMAPQAPRLVRGEDHDRVLGQLWVRVQRVKDPLGLVVHVLLQLVIEPAVLLAVRHRLEGLGVLIDVVLLARRAWARSSVP